MTASVREPGAAPAGPSARRLTANFLLLTGGEGLAKVATFAAFIYLARVLGPDRYGGLEFVLAAMVFFTLPVDLGLGTYGARELARHRGRAADLLREVTALRLLLAGASFALVVLLAAVLPRGPEDRALLLVYGLTLLAEPLMLQWFFQGHDSMHWVALATLIRRWGFALLVLAVARADTPLPWVGACECAAAAAVVAFGLAVLRRRMGMALPLPRVRPAALGGHLRQSAPIGLSELAWAFLWYFATVLLGLFVAGEELGWFGAAHRIVMALHTFVWLYFFNLLPTLARGVTQPGERLRALVGRSVGLTAWGGVLVALVVTLLAGKLLGLAFGPRYAGAATPLTVLVWMIPVALLSGHYRYLLIAGNRQRLECLCTACSAAVALGLGATLIPPFGAAGAAAALLTASVVNLILACAFAWREVAPVPFHRQVALPLLAAAGALACFKALSGAGAWTAAAGATAAYLVPFAVWGRRHLLPRPAASAEGAL
jgi:O-antigen/teichoic acid export membrane protein